MSVTTYSLTPSAREKLDRIRSFRRAGVPKQSIAKVMNVLHSDERMDRYLVAKILNGHVPMHWRDLERAA